MTERAAQGSPGAEEGAGLARPGVQILLLALITLVAYWPSLGVPFYFDDFRGIDENLALHDPADLEAIWEFAPQRFVGSLTLAWNHALHGGNVLGYHLVNTAIHLLAGLALWAFLRAALRGPALDPAARPWLRWVPLLAAALFLAHPLQTQAVTYVVQRYASLAALLYLATLACYTWGRIKGSTLLLAAAGVCALLAVFTKQNAVTVFAAVALAELVLLRMLDARARLAVVAGTLLAAVLVVWLVNLPPLDAWTRETREISRIDYLATQMGVLWRYVGLFFLPVEQRLEYDLALVRGFLHPGVLLAAAGHAAVIAVGFALWRRAPLAAFGILFYYLAHVVESSIVPISDLAFEHRTYLPNAGLATLAATVLAWGGSRLPAPRAAPLLAPALAASLVAVAVGATVQRNLVWQDPIAFYRQEARLSPGKERAWTALGKELMREGRFSEALEAFGTALNLARTDEGLEVRPVTLLNTVLALHYTGQHEKAFEMAELLPLDMLAPVERSRLFEVRGVALARMGRHASARQSLVQAVQVYPNLDAVAWIAHVDLLEGKPELAAKRARMVLDKEPGHAVAAEVLARAEHGRSEGEVAPEQRAFDGR